MASGGIIASPKSASVDDGHRADIFADDSPATLAADRLDLEPIQAELPDLATRRSAGVRVSGGRLRVRGTPALVHASPPMKLRAAFAMAMVFWVSTAGPIGATSALLLFRQPFYRGRCSGTIAPGRTTTRIPDQTTNRKVSHGDRDRQYANTRGAVSEVSSIKDPRLWRNFRRDDRCRVKYFGPDMVASVVADRSPCHLGGSVGAFAAWFCGCYLCGPTGRGSVDAPRPTGR